MLFTEKERLIGDSAKIASSQNPTNTVYDAKRLIGRDFNDSSLQEDMKSLTYAIVNESNKPSSSRISWRKTFTPEEISSMILVRLKETAENYLGLSVKTLLLQFQLISMMRNVKLQKMLL